MMLSHPFSFVLCVIENERDAFRQRGLDVDHRKGGTANASTVEEKDEPWRCGGSHFPERGEFSCRIIRFCIGEVYESLHLVFAGFWQPLPRGQTIFIIAAGIFSISFVFEHISPSPCA